MVRGSEGRLHRVCGEKKAERSKNKKVSEWRTNIKEGNKRRLRGRKKRENRRKEKKRNKRRGG
jgi:hypothetical protein